MKCQCQLLLLKANATSHRVTHRLALDDKEKEEIRVQNNGIEAQANQVKALIKATDGGISKLLGSMETSQMLQPITQMPNRTSPVTPTPTPTHRKDATSLEDGSQNVSQGIRFKK
jgi:hypothetical protein